MKIIPLFTLIALSVWLLSCETPSKASGELSNPAITGIRWKLIELNGQPVDMQPPNGKEPFVMFEASGNKLTGQGGCNGFGGTYSIKQNNGIRLSQLISTKMACNSLRTETQFMDILSKADNYEVEGMTLTLRELGAASIAKFIAVQNKN